MAGYSFARRPRENEASRPHSRPLATRRAVSCQAEQATRSGSTGDPNDDGARSAAARDDRPGLGRRGRSSSRALTVQFRVQFLDASGTIIREMHAAAWNAAAAIALVEGMEWPAGAVRMVILNEAGGEVHSELK